MYLSPAVRTMRDDPTPGVETTLIVRLEDRELEPALAVVREHDGEVAKETQFGNLHVVVDEPDVAALLDALHDGLPESVAAVETVTSELSGDAGEDVESPGDHEP